MVKKIIATCTEKIDVLEELQDLQSLVWSTNWYANPNMSSIYNAICLLRNKLHKTTKIKCQ